MLRIVVQAKRAVVKGGKGHLRKVSSWGIQGAKALNRSLEETDREVFDIIEKEKRRQRNCLSLIASENFMSTSVLESLGSVMSNKYSEGYPGKRYYGGNMFIDQAEVLCINRALGVYNLDAEKWGVNVQTLSGSPANFQAYTAVLEPHDRIMALDLPHGGHLSHGYQVGSKKISASSKFFESMPYRLDERTGLIDYDKLEESAALFRPKLIIAGASAYSRNIDYARMREIADQHDAYLLADMAHISGLVAAGVVPSPFEFADIVTTTTHKSLRGPRGAMIFYRKGVRKVDKGNEIKYDLDEKVNFTVFPGLQGGPHNHTIAALATALKQATSPMFKLYQEMVLDNCQGLVQGLASRGYEIISGGSDNHLCLVNLKKSKGIDGARVERVLELANIVINKNTVPGDKSALSPGGMRLGSPALTTRGMNRQDFDFVAELVDRGVQAAIEVRDATGKRLNDFHRAVEAPNKFESIITLRKDVTDFVRKFPTIGFDESSMVYKD